MSPRLSFDRTGKLLVWKLVAAQITAPRIYGQASWWMRTSLSVRLDQVVYIALLDHLRHARFRNSSSLQSCATDNDL